MNYSNRLKIECFDRFDLVEKHLQKEWNSLLIKSDTVTIFLTYEWIKAWWHAYGAGKALWIFAARNSDGKLVGLAPLFSHRSKYYKIGVTELTFIGEKSSDRQSFIIHKDHSEAYAAIFHEIVTRVNCDIIRLEQVPEDSPLLRTIKHYPKVETEIDTTLPYLTIDTNWSNYYKKLSKKFKKDLRHKYNVLKRKGDWKFICLTGATEITQNLEKIAQFEIDSQKGSGQYALFADHAAYRLHKKFLELSSPHQWVNLFLLSANDTLISYLIAFVFNNKICAYNMAFAPDYYRMSPGKLILNEAVKASHEDQYAEIDFLRGNSYIKSLWTKTERHNYRIVFFKSSIKSSTLRYFVFYLRPALKNLYRRPAIQTIINKTPYLKSLFE